MFICFSLIFIFLVQRCEVLQHFFGLWFHNKKNFFFLSQKTSIFRFWFHFNVEKISDRTMANVTHERNEFLSLFRRVNNKKGRKKEEKAILFTWMSMKFSSLKPYNYLTIFDAKMTSLKSYKPSVFRSSFHSISPWLFVLPNKKV